MRVLIVIAVLVAVLAVHAPASAQDVEALRRELEQMRRQFDAMKQQYQQAIDAMSERLQRLEARPPSGSSGTSQPPPATAASPPGGAQAAPPGTAPAPPSAPTSTAQASAPTSAAPTSTAPASAPASAAPPSTAPAAVPSALDLARPREPFALSQQRGAGQLLFDMGVTGDFVGNLTASNVEKARGGTFAGQENRFFPREIELSLFGQIDPYARAEVRIEAGEEARSADTTVSLAEASVTLLTLPYGTQAKFGQIRPRFGYSNVIHEHDLPWVDRPNVLRRFFGDDGLKEKGVEATIVPDLPFYVEGLVGVFNGDNDTAFGRGSLRAPLFTGRLRTFLEPGDTHAVQLGMSVASGDTGERHRDTVLGWEARYKYRPDGWLHPLVTVTGEALYALRVVDVGVDLDGDGLPDAVRARERDRWGWYLGAEVQPFRRWAFGVRYDWSEFPVNPGVERAVEPYVTFWPSEFLRFRLAYKNTDRTRRVSFDGEGSARRLDEILFQGTFILGAHPAHPF